MKELKPEQLWKNFENICNIPHPSKYEQNLIKWIAEFADNLSLEKYIDATGNIIIYKPATKGLEKNPMITLQAHIDMVPQKNDNIIFDFKTDKIKTYIDGDWLTAKDTTLGADNGIGVAAMLAILESDDIAHNAIECLFTVDEETGMTGAFNLEPNILKGEYLLNLDSEEEGEICCGCAGGREGTVSFDYQEELLNKKKIFLNIDLRGLKGGHSGVDINLGRANANKIIIDYLLKIIEYLPVSIISLKGGTLRNAIPREANVKLVIENTHHNELIAFSEQYIYDIKEKYKNIEDNISLKLTKEKPYETKIADSAEIKKILSAINAVKNGPLKISDKIDNFVLASSNLGLINIEKGKGYILTLQRKASFQKNDKMALNIKEVFQDISANIAFAGEYPGWQSEDDSIFCKKLKEIYYNIFNKNAIVKGIHAGLEPGIIMQSNKFKDALSIGPTIKYPHSPDEKVNIESVEKFWKYLVEIIKS